MRKARFKETEIVRVLNEVEGGRQVKEVCRKYGISDATYYKWKSKYGGMDASELKRIKQLEAALWQYKRMYAELARENDAMKDLIAKKL